MFTAAATAFALVATAMQAASEPNNIIPLGTGYGVNPETCGIHAMGTLVNDNGEATNYISPLPVRDENGIAFDEDCMEFKESVIDIQGLNEATAVGLSHMDPEIRAQFQNALINHILANSEETRLRLAAERGMDFENCQPDQFCAEKTSDVTANGIRHQTFTITPPQPGN